VGIKHQYTPKREKEKKKERKTESTGVDPTGYLVWWQTGN
jgi:hypothetical protein